MSCGIFIVVYQQTARKHFIRRQYERVCEEFGNQVTDADSENFDLEFSRHFQMEAELRSFLINYIEALTLTKSLIAV